MKEAQLRNKDIKRPLEFKAFYWMCWIQLTLLGVLYWWAAINLNYFTEKQKADSEQDGDKLYDLLVVLLRYVPTIMMTMGYVLIYFQT